MSNERPELSTRNKYWIDRHRYYELKHFCLQYKKWKKLYSKIDGYSKQSSENVSTKTNSIQDVTANAGMIKLYYSTRIEMVERAAKTADNELAEYILKGVTEGLSFDSMSSTIPCSRATYYDSYRKFFYILDRLRL